MLEWRRWPCCHPAARRDGDDEERCKLHPTIDIRPPEDDVRTMSSRWCA